MDVRTSTLKNTAKEAALSVSTLGLALVMPQVFHYFGLGKEFLPMFFPLIVLSLLSVRNWTGLVPAVLAPIVSTLLFGMPALSVSVAVAVELVFLFLTVRFAVNRKWNLFVVLPLALVAGRLFSFAGQMLSNGGHADKALAFTAAAYPGLIALFVTGSVIILLKNIKAVNEK